MRLAVYIELLYNRDEAGYSTDQPFMRFVLALRPHVDRLVLVGRVDPVPGRLPYAIADDVDVVALPHYPTLKDVRGLARGAPVAVRRIWRAVGNVDAVWAIGPHPLSLPVALAGAARRRRVVLGVRQHFPDYVRHRLPSARWMPAVAAAWTLEAAFRLLGRRLPAVVVGPDLARRYRSRAPRLDVEIALVPAVDAERPRPAAERADDRVELLSVGRLDPEKAPELLLQMLRVLRERGDRDYRLTLVGGGDLEAELRRAAEPLGNAVRFLGHVPHGPALFDVYRSSDLFVHTSRTEGLPSVLLEAQVFGLPVVATDVGGVRAALDGGSAGLLVPPSDPAALADAVDRVAGDRSLADRLRRAGAARAQGVTLERAAARVAAFLQGEQAHA